MSTWYDNYSPNMSYNPYLRSSYTPRSSLFEPHVNSASSWAEQRDQEERVHALAERRARRAQYLPDEEDDDNADDDAWWSNQWNQQRQRAVKARQEAMEQQYREEQMKKLQEEELRRQQAIEQQRRRREELENRYKYEEELRQRMVEVQKNQIRMRREEEARRQAAAAEQERQTRMAQQNAQRRTQSRSPSHPPNFQSKHTLEEQTEAALRIQKQFRIRTSFQTLRDIQAQFEKVKHDFVYPRTIDFENSATEGGVIAVPAYSAPSDLDCEDYAPMDVDGNEGKLAYTSTNSPLHTYSDALDKLLMKLDGIESWGQKSIREQRRAEVKSIEKEASKLDRYWKQAWWDYVAKSRSQTSSEQQSLSSTVPPDSLDQSFDSTVPPPSLEQQSLESSVSLGSSERQSLDSTVASSTSEDHSLDSTIPSSDTSERTKTESTPCQMQEESAVNGSTQRSAEEDTTGNQEDDTMTDYVIL